MWKQKSCRDGNSLGDTAKELLSFLFFPFFTEEKAQLSPKFSYELLALICISSPLVSKTDKAFILCLFYLSYYSYSLVMACLDVHNFLLLQEKRFELFDLPYQLSIGESQ